MRRPSFHRLVLLILLAWRGTAAAALAQPQTVVKLEPRAIQAVAGESVELRVAIEGVQNLGAFQFTLTYNPDLVEVEAISVGDFPASTGRNVNPLGPKLETGRALFGAFSFGEARGPDGDGVLAVVALTVKGSGTSELQLEDVQVVDVSGNRIPTQVEGGSIRVAGTPVPQSKAQVPAVATPATATPTTSLPLAATLTAMREGRDKPDTPSTPWQEWAIVVAVLAGLIGLIALLARQLARSVS